MLDAAKRQRSLVGVGSLESADSAENPARVLFDVKLCVERGSTSLTALVDCGADESFIDARAASQLTVALEPISEPRRALGLNGRLLTHIH